MEAQLPDNVLLNGVNQSLYSNPLESYWVMLDKRRPAFFSLPNCKRGYVATWEIKSSQLYLKEIEGKYKRSFSFLFRKKISLYTRKLLFPKAGDRLVKASWFSGKLRIPHGKMTAYNEDYDSRFEQEIIISVIKGNITKMVTIDYNQRVLIVSTQAIKKACA